MKQQPDDNDVLREKGPLALDPELGLEPVTVAQRCDDLAARAASRGADPTDDPWSRAITATQLLNEVDSSVEWLAAGLAAPGSVTGIASPRGLGKSHLLHALGVAAATGGEFLGETLSRFRVLLLDRDNSRREVRRRLRGWGRDNDLSNLKVLTRDDCPPLTDRAHWEAFPFAEYDLVILDSLGAATEGVEDNRGGDSSRTLAPLLDLARHGPAVVVALNTPKNGLNFRGSGIIADRLDVLFEVRDATDLKPDPKRASWWATLAEGQGEGGWADRAARRRRRDSYRLALVASKFRIGEEPDPRCVEIALSGDWSVADVTVELEAAHEAARVTDEAVRGATAEQAVESLARLVAERAASGRVVNKTEAEDHLRGLGLTQKHARSTIERLDGERWAVQEKDKRSKVLVPCESRPTTRLLDGVLPRRSGVSDWPNSVTPVSQGQRDSTRLEPLSGKGQSDPRISSSNPHTRPAQSFDDDDGWGEIEVNRARG